MLEGERTLNWPEALEVGEEVYRQMNGERMIEGVEGGNDEPEDMRGRSSTLTS